MMTPATLPTVVAKRSYQTSTSKGIEEGLTFEITVTIGSFRRVLVVPLRTWDLAVVGKPIDLPALRHLTQLARMATIDAAVKAYHAYPTGKDSLFAERMNAGKKRK